MFTLNDILQGQQGPVHIHSNFAVDPGLVFRAAHHDSRQIEPGDLFIALKGKQSRVDGHRFIADAARCGARGALCSEPAPGVPADFLQIVVPNALATLQATARSRVQHQQGTTLIGITGSNGKTSTKEAVATVLSQAAPTLKTFASYNTEIGYPLTLLRLEPQHRYAVLEMGAQYVGELTMLCTIASPQWSIITNVGTSHLEYFGSQERIAIAKSELVQVLTADGIAMLNYDDLNVRAMSAKTRARILYYGLGEGADVRGSEIEGNALFGYRFTLSYQGQRTRVQLHLPGEHGITIALAAATAGIVADIPLEEIGQTLETLVPAKRRGEIKLGPNGSTIIDDSYNASRSSILAIVKAMYATPLAAGGKRWAVLGDILELGSYALEEHKATGAALANKVDYLVAIGDYARFYVEGALEGGLPAERAWYFSANLENSTELEGAKRAAADLLMHRVQGSDLVLLKGSLGVAMDTLLALL